MGYYLWCSAPVPAADAGGEGDRRPAPDPFAGATMKKLVVLSLVAGIWGSLGAAGLQAAEVERIGKKIDNFTLKSHFGKEYSLAVNHCSPLPTIWSPRVC